MRDVSVVLAQGSDTTKIHKFAQIKNKLRNWSVVRDSSAADYMTL